MPIYNRISSIPETHQGKRQFDLLNEMVFIVRPSKQLFLFSHLFGSTHRNQSIMNPVCGEGGWPIVRPNPPSESTKFTYFTTYPDSHHQHFQSSRQYRYNADEPVYYERNYFLGFYHLNTILCTFAVNLAPTLENGNTLKENSDIGNPRALQPYILFRFCNAGSTTTNADK